LNELELEGPAPREPRRIAQFFSVTGNLFGARDAGKELVDLGWSDPTIIEEVKGDEDWHLTVYRTQPVTAELIADLRVLMTDIASRHGGQYDGWDLAVLTPERRLPPHRLEA
jgi:hypothetical protein